MICRFEFCQRQNLKRQKVIAKTAKTIKIIMLNSNHRWYNIQPKYLSISETTYYNLTQK